MSQRLILSERKLDFKHLTKIEFTLWPGEPVRSNVHPLSDSCIGLLGTLVVKTGVGTSQGSFRKLLQAVRIPCRYSFIQRDERLGFECSCVGTTMPENSSQGARAVAWQSIEQFPLESHHFCVVLQFDTHRRNWNGRSPLHNYRNG